MGRRFRNANRPLTVQVRSALELALAGAVFSGKTAAWLHGLEIGPRGPIEMIAPIKPAITVHSQTAN